jgi:CheY-like chemotaxis protein
MRNGHILVVTSDAHLGARCADALRPGFAPLIADDPERALLSASRERIEGLVVDLDAPGVDMLNVVDALRSYGPTRDIAIVAIVSSFAEDLFELARQHGVDHLVVRPVDCEKIAGALEMLVGGRISQAA